MDFRVTLSYHLESLQERKLDDYLKTVCLDKVLLIMPDGKLINNGNQFIELHKNWFAKTNWKMECEIVKIAEGTEIAYTLIKVHYEELDENDNPTTMDYYLNLIFKKFDNRWLLIHDQNTVFEK
ncbi:nuclear transport factor 2 family protein [Vallitalea pronyensis]|uniref:Nuclear transport factor 2 family protein n=1 Tax=Vallitalea pronyensis TaxID=1348613 RepID=A0A8J8MKS0_9FIRM|nr:nuclear transport factor 2 family protein [Vallitalea pronyensis]QUI23349.1 nuclear transport factor 2 family protein [Vallitalea pronyensis]